MISKDVMEILPFVSNPGPDSHIEAYRILMNMKTDDSRWDIPSDQNPAGDY